MTKITNGTLFRALKWLTDNTDMVTANIFTHKGEQWIAIHIGASHMPYQGPVPLHLTGATIMGWVVEMALAWDGRDKPVNSKPCPIRSCSGVLNVQHELTECSSCGHTPYWEQEKVAYFRCVAPVA